MAKVGIVMGSDSDMPIMAKAAEILDKFGIDYEMTIISAHREPDIFFEWAKSAEEKGIKVIIAGAGKAAHLPGMCADAVRNSGCNGSHQRRCQCRHSGSQDPCNFRRRAACKAEKLQ